jgi:hypothetical protein
MEAKNNRVMTLILRRVMTLILRRVALVITDVPPKRRFSQQPHGVASQKTAFFIVTAVKTSNLTQH